MIWYFMIKNYPGNPLSKKIMSFPFSQKQQTVTELKQQFSYFFILVHSNFSSLVLRLYFNYFYVGDWACPHFLEDFYVSHQKAE
jgi:hypothetical protein